MLSRRAQRFLILILFAFETHSQAFDSRFAVGEAGRSSDTGSSLAAPVYY
jgi:hypothetical protein